jgi:predicted O-linked N-acetylglucosamine transferase (SPINDLY family)
MSKLFENKQIIHIATEVVVLLGITFYFSQKNKKLLEHIEDLSQRLEDQEDMIQKHEQIIKQLVQAVNTRQLQEPPRSKHNNLKRQSTKLQKSVPKPVKPVKPTKPVTSNIKVHYKPDPDNIEIHEVLESDSDNDSELDKEIQEELQEMDDD